MKNIVVMLGLCIICAGKIVAMEQQPKPACTADACHEEDAAIPDSQTQTSQRHSSTAFSAEQQARVVYVPLEDFELLKSRVESVERDADAERDNADRNQNNSAANQPQPAAVQAARNQQPQPALQPAAQNQQQNGVQGKSKGGQPNIYQQAGCSRRTFIRYCWRDCNWLREDIQ